MQENLYLGVGRRNITSSGLTGSGTIKSDRLAAQTDAAHAKHIARNEMYFI